MNAYKLLIDDMKSMLDRYQNDIVPKLFRLLEEREMQIGCICELLKEQPKVTRCKDCKHYEIHKPKVLENCERNGYLIPMKPDDFCSFGERKNNGEA